MKTSKLQPSPSTTRETYGPVTELEQVPTGLLESVELANATSSDPRLSVMLQSIVDLLFARPKEFVQSVTGGANE